MKRTISHRLRREFKTGVVMHAPNWYFNSIRLQVQFDWCITREDCKIYFWLGRMLRGTFCEYYNNSIDNNSPIPTSGEVFTVIRRKRWTSLRRRCIYR